MMTRSAASSAVHAAGVARRAATERFGGQLRCRSCRTSPDVDFEALFASSYPRVLAYARVMVRSAEAEDVVADTYMIAWRKRAQIPSGAELGWLIGVARRVISNRRRGDRRLDALRARLASQPRGVGLDPAEVIADDELRRALNTLAPLDREALLLVTWFDLAPIDAATALDIPAAAFRMRLSRARRRMRSALEPQTHYPKERERWDTV
jgi:RNA polymerase sigma factor (sigma-70 family)